MHDSENESYYLINSNKQLIGNFIVEWDKFKKNYLICSYLDSHQLRDNRRWIRSWEALQIEFLPSSKLEKQQYAHIYLEVLVDGALYYLVLASLANHDQPLSFAVR